MTLCKGFVRHWADVLSSVNRGLLEHSTYRRPLTVYSHRLRCQRYFLKYPYEDVYLTPQEWQTAVQLLKRRTMRQAAAALNLSHRTVEFYLKSIKKKLGCHKKKQLLKILEQVIDYKIA